MTPTRYAIYYVPDEGADWARFCTSWLGWDMIAAAPAPHPELSGLPLPVEEITKTPRKYGLHATLKPPFRLAEGQDAAALETACATMAAGLSPFDLDGLSLQRLGSFLALQIEGDAAPMNALAATCVEALDAFRAPAPPEELERRRAAGLSAAQEDNLARWGYPYVMESFRFHVTLSGRLGKGDLAAVQAALDHALSPMLPAPFPIRDIALAGEAPDGRFHLIRRFPLGG